MKKGLLTTLLFISFLFSFAQQWKNNSELKNGNNSAAVTLTIIGSSTFDLQSYGSARKQIYFDSAGTAGVAFNYCSGTPFVDSSQTAYNFFDGSVWPGPFSLNSIPLFGAIDRLSNGTEIMLSYDSTSVSGLRIDTSNVPGSGIWAGTALPPEPNGHQCGWPHMAVGGTNAMSVHVVSLTEPVAYGGFPYNGVDGILTYSRSEDGGATWNIVYATLPGWDSLITARLYPDQYAIDAKGSVVAITAGGKTNDWVIFKSTDNGITWTMTVIKAFPGTAYDEFTMTTDTNSDGTADTLLVPDGSMAVLIDLNYNIHCWSGNIGVVDNTPAGGFEYAYHYSTGLNYWNEMMGSSPPIVISSPVNITNDIAKYGVGVASMPSAGISSVNNIYVTYSSLVPGSSNGGNPDQAFRNISVTCGIDTGGGIVWIQPVFVAPDIFSEQVFPCMARDINQDAGIIFQQDGEPGMSVRGDLDLFTINDIMYAEFRADSIILTSIPPVAGIKNKINIKPNPFREVTHLSFNNDNHELININLIDVSGRVIKTIRAAGTKFLLDASDIEKGIYILRVSNPANSEVQVAKLVKD